MLAPAIGTYRRHGGTSKGRKLSYAYKTQRAYLRDSETVQLNCKLYWHVLQPPETFSHSSFTLAHPHGVLPEMSIVLRVPWDATDDGLPVDQVYHRLARGMEGTCTGGRSHEATPRTHALNREQERRTIGVGGGWGRGAIQR